MKTEPSDLLWKNKVHSTLCAHSKYILFSAKRGFFTQCTILCCSVNPTQARHNSLSVLRNFKGPNSSLQKLLWLLWNTAHDESKAVCIYLLLQLENSKETAAAALETVISVSHSVNTHWGLPGEHFSPKPFQKSVPRQDYTHSFLPGVTQIFITLALSWDRDVPQTALLLLYAWFIFFFFFCLSEKPFSGFKVTEWMGNKHQQRFDAWQPWRRVLPWK